MRLVNSSDTSYLFDLSKQEEDSIDADFHEWCESMLGEKAKWSKPNQQVEIADPELALKFKLRWALEE